MREHDAQLGEHVGDEPRAVEPGRGRAAPQVGHAEVLQRDLRGLGWPARKIRRRWPSGLGLMDGPEAVVIGGGAAGSSSSAAGVVVIAARSRRRAAVGRGRGRRCCGRACLAPSPAARPAAAPLGSLPPPAAAAPPARASSSAWTRARAIAASRSWRARSAASSLRDLGLDRLSSCAAPRGRCMISARRVGSSFTVAAAASGRGPTAARICRMCLAEAAWFVIAWPGG